MAPSSTGSSGSVPTAPAVTAVYSNGQQPPVAAGSGGEHRLPNKAKGKDKEKKTDKKKKNKKKAKKKTTEEKVPLMAKVKQAQMAHKMTKGLTWRQRWKLFKCYRKLRKLCPCCLG